MGEGYSDKNCILIIDDDSINRDMLIHIFSSQYDYEEAENGLDGLKKIEENYDRICAILMDVSMPVMSGIELLRILYSKGITQRIPVFLITASTEYEIIKEGYELGVMDVINKPVTPFVILRRVQNLIELFKARESLGETVLGQAEKLKENVETIDLLHRTTIEALASAIEFRDVESGEHTNRIYSVTKTILSNTEFGDGLSKDDIEDIAIASIMHDVGKIAISDVILNKPGKLTSDEFEVMKTHTTKGAMLMKQIAQIQTYASYQYACDIALHHHERWDGRGYPEGLKGNEISTCAQVVSIADVYDALVSPRVYKKAYTPDKAVQMIVNGECGTFNPELVKCFLKVEPELRKLYTFEAPGEEKHQNAEAKKKEVFNSMEKGSADVSLGLNREVVDVLLLMAAVQSAYDMIICVNLTKNSYYMIDYDRFLTHVAGYDGVFDELIEGGASAVPESHREAFVNAFCRESLLNAYRNGKKSVYLEHPQLADDGVEHMVATTVLFIEDPKTEDVMEITLSCYIDDEWEEREKTKQILSDALIVAEKANNAKSDFLSRMSHDIRTPLNAIIGMTKIIDSSIDDKERIKDCIDKIGISSKYLLGLINDILDFSQIESGNMSINEHDFDIRRMIEDVRTIVDTRAVEKNQQFDISVDDEVAKVYKGDSFRVRQILINILDNAHKYTLEGGRYSLKVHVGKDTVTHHFLVFEVEDNGIGISDLQKERIFNPFVQCNDMADSSGVGLGLAITRNLVHLMNGRLDVKSVPNEGTRFIVEIPFEVCGLGSEQGDINNLPDDANGKVKIEYNGEKILVAEDNELNQEIIKTVLEMENLSVDVVSNGKEAVERFLQSEPGEYLVIFMDVSMPEMNGYEATRKIRRSSHKEAQTIPIYALTANAFYSDVMEAKNNGMNGHLAKPIDFEQVSEVLNREIVARK